MFSDCITVFTVCCYLKRRDSIEKQKLKWTRILTGDLEPQASTAAPDMSKLRLVKVCVCHLSCVVTIELFAKTLNDI